MSQALDVPPPQQGAPGPPWSPSPPSPHGGHAGLADFRTPGNPYFPGPELMDRLRQGMAALLTHHPLDAGAVTAEACAALGLHPQTVVLGNGSTELVTWIDHLLLRESVAVPVPTSRRWTDQPLGTGKRVDMFLLREEDGFRLDVDAYLAFVRQRGSRAAVLCNPNNPDGTHLPRSEVLRLLDGLADLDLVVVDESAVDFADAEQEPSVADQAVLRPNVVVLRSLGRNAGLPGVRLGHLVANPALAHRIRGALPPRNLNSFAEAMVLLLRERMAEYRESLRIVVRDRQAMFRNLQAVPGLGVLPSQANYLLTRLPEGVDGARMREALLDGHGVSVGACGDRLGMGPRFLRLAVRPVHDQQRLVAGMLAVLYGTGAAPGWPSTPLPPSRAAAQLPAGQGTAPAPPAGAVPQLPAGQAYPAQVQQVPLPQAGIPQVAVPQIAVQQMHPQAMPPGYGYGYPAQQGGPYPYAAAPQG
ncbi:aminotransferase class I/II-fold pyridoxal phosphate-dependent enzyme [Streptacidiphilus sp. ASG 303]|uniref:pyridoxal phosphate-dependent aminotransferase n=1 Tax=Streptacidiphilus sp. ASG 303 TaxID=2896847 RepID=UPI001E356A79|nr:aminotransferase class I/II-fold pyridoxal phosphate-dependent enzyme [Streptacidiphilus sp. ASG 303]MCD0483112.1 aminotransferase class I/II-fold pyridoxal phosphate-dependent enzyme [Streptacidiphilus sp. ASG 303]